MPTDSANEFPDIRPRPIEFVKFRAVDYYMYAPPDCPPEDAGVIFQDLLVAIYTNAEPKYAVNKAAVKEAYAYIARKRKKIEEYKQKKFGPKATPPPSDAGQNLFTKKSIPEHWQNLPRHELEKIMIDAGITPEKFHIWYEDSLANDWCDKNGKPIRDPLAACRGYFKFPAKEKEQ